MRANDTQVTPVPHVPPRTGRDLVVVGASLGGIDALRALVGGLPPDLPAAVVVVQHTAPHSAGTLGEILDRAGPLPARLAEDGEALRPGVVRRWPLPPATDAPPPPAEELRLSVSTVEAYREPMKEKLGVERSPKLLRYAVRWCRDRAVALGR